MISSLRSRRLLVLLLVALGAAVAVAGWRARRARATTPLVPAGMPSHPRRTGPQKAAANADVELVV